MRAVVEAAVAGLLVILAGIFFVMWSTRGAEIQSLEEKLAAAQAEAAEVKPLITRPTLETKEPMTQKTEQSIVADSKWDVLALGPNKPFEEWTIDEKKGYLFRTEYSWEVHEDATLAYEGNDDLIGSIDVTGEKIKEFATIVENTNIWFSSSSGINMERGSTKVNLPFDWENWQEQIRVIDKDNIAVKLPDEKLGFVWAVARAEPFTYYFEEWSHRSKERPYTKK